jgi:hypothetical protein
VACRCRRKTTEACGRDETLSLRAGQSFSAIEHLPWIKLQGGSAAFMGEPDLQITPATPLCRYAMTYGRARFQR